MKNEEFLTSKEISKYLNIPLRTIQKLSQHRKIKGIKIGKQWRFRKNDIERYLTFGTYFPKEPAGNSNDFIERRAYSRINSNFKCQYLISLQPFREINNEGIVKELSANGVFLFIQGNEIDEIKVNDPIKLRFVLISDNDQRTHISTKGKVVRKCLDGLGIKLKNINKETQDRIMEYTG